VLVIVIESQGRETEFPRQERSQVQLGNEGKVQLGNEESQRPTLNVQIRKG
jgi:hypothetical protein